MWKESYKTTCYIKKTFWKTGHHWSIDYWVDCDCAPLRVPAEVRGTRAPGVNNFNPN